MLKVVTHSLSPQRRAGRKKGPDFRSMAKGDRLGEGDVAFRYAAMIKRRAAAAALVSSVWQRFE